MDRDTQAAEYERLMGAEARKRQKEAVERMRCRCKISHPARKVPGEHHNPECGHYVKGLKP